MAYIGATPTAVPLTGADIEDGTIQLADLSATGTPSASTFLRGDGAWQSAGGTNTPAFSAKVSSNQSVATSTATLVAFDTEIFDSNGTYDNTATNYKFTPAVAGKYLITTFCRFENIENNRGLFLLYKNGSLLVGSEAAGKVSDASSDVSGTIAYIDDVNITDYYQIYGFHNYGSNRDIRVDSVFSGFKIIE